MQFLAVVGYSLLGFLAVMTVITLVAWVLYVPLVVRVFSETPYLFAENHVSHNEGEPCQFQTSDGLLLQGTYLATPAERRLGVIVYCHEMTADRWAAIRYVQDLRERGFDILLFDFRNHGTSQRLEQYEPMPWVTRYEVCDVLAAVRYAMSRPDADPRGVGILGTSKGGTAALCAAAECPQIRALVTDGAYPLEEMQLHYMRRYMQIYFRFSWLINRLPDGCLFSFVRWARYVVGWRRGCKFVNVTQVVRRIRQPVFLIHGERDAYVPLEAVHQLRNAISRRTRLWVVQGAKHNRAIHVATDRYQRRVARFFQYHLPAAEAAAESRSRHSAKRAAS